MFLSYTVGMKKIHLALAVVVVVVISLFIYLNNQPKEVALETQEQPNTSLANPAAVLCLEAGGVSEKVVDSEGESANCTFSSGAICEEWALFLGECNVEGVSNTGTYTDGTTTVFVIYRIFNDTAILNASSLKLENVELKPAMSASGARYQTTDGKIEFWEHQGEGTLSVDGRAVFVGRVKESFTPSEVYRGTDSSGRSLVFQQQDYTKYRLITGDDVVTGELNTERGWKNDEDATVYVLNWQKPEKEQIIFVRKTAETNKVFQLNAQREEMVPSVTLTLSN